MSAIDFCEIAQANTGEGDQDRFELFARDFLVSLNFEIAEQPARGPDGGRDLVVVERLRGELQTVEFRWLVSCKHFAHGAKGKGRSVGVGDEGDLLDRLEASRCSGFIGFYSTLPSEGLMQRIRGLEARSRRFLVLDGAGLESHIVGIKAREVLFQRYFPQSYISWQKSQHAYEPVRLFEFYFNEKLKGNRAIFPILKRAFDIPQDLIKPLRVAASLEELLEKRTYLLKVRSEEEVRGIISTPHPVSPQGEMLDLHIHQILAEQFPDSEQFGSLMRMEWVHRNGCWIILSAAAVVSERAYALALEDFAEMKSMLD